MPDWLVKLLESVHLPTPLVAALCLASAVLLFAPTAAVSRLHLDTLATAQGPIIGAVFLVSAAVLVCKAAWEGADKIRRSRARHKRSLAAVRKALDLDPKEAAVLREFFLQGQSTIRMPVADPVVAGLLDAGVLVSKGVYAKVSLHGPMQPLALSSDVEAFTAPESLGMPDEPTPDEKDAILNQRPVWALSHDLGVSRRRR